MNKSSRPPKHVLDHFTALAADMNKSTKLGKTKTAPQNNQISQAENKEDSNKIVTADHTEPAKSTERSQNKEETIQNDQSTCPYHLRN